MAMATWRAWRELDHPRRQAQLRSPARNPANQQRESRESPAVERGHGPVARADHEKAFSHWHSDSPSLPCRAVVAGYASRSPSVGALRAMSPLSRGAAVFCGRRRRRASRAARSASRRASAGRCAASLLSYPRARAAAPPARVCRARAVRSGGLTAAPHPPGRPPDGQVALRRLQESRMRRRAASCVRRRRARSCGRRAGDGQAVWPFARTRHTRGPRARARAHGSPALRRAWRAQAPPARARTRQVGQVPRAAPRGAGELHGVLRPRLLPQHDPARSAALVRHTGLLDCTAVAARPSLWHESARAGRAPTSLV